MKLQAVFSLLLEASITLRGPQLRSGRDSPGLAVYPELPACPPLPEQAAGLLIKYKAFAGRGCSDGSLGVARPEAFIGGFQLNLTGKGQTQGRASPHSGAGLPPRV